MARMPPELRQIVELARPRTIRTLSRAGALGPGSAVALATSWPWLLGRGPSLGIVSQLNRIAVPNKPAIFDRRGSLTWADLDRRANRAARAMRDLGVAPGDRVALLLRNGREFAEVLLAAQKVGIVACPLNTWARRSDVRASLEALEPRVLVFDAMHADQVPDRDRAGLALVQVGDGTAGRARRARAEDYERLLDDQSDAPPPPVALDRGSPRVIIHTSGTTGAPKGADRDASVTGIREFTGLLATVPLHRDDVIFCPAPLFHSFGLLAFATASLLGATLVLPEKFDPEDALRLLQAHRATAAALVPVMIRRIVSLPDETRWRYDVSSLRVLLASGSAIPEELREAVRGVFGDVLYDLYGSTEAGWISIATPEDALARPGTVGKPVAGVDVAVFDPDGGRLGPNESGELFIRSSAVFSGYTSGEGRSERDGYITIGDLGHLDDDGYLFVDGRADDMVVIGGENVYPQEVEDVIRGVPGVEDVAVIGVDDREYGQVLAAFVVGAVDPERIGAACRDRLSSFKVPRRIERIPELPRTSTGKVLKRELR